MKYLILLIVALSATSCSYYKSNNNYYYYDSRDMPNPNKERASTTIIRNYQAKVLASPSDTIVPVELETSKFNKLGRFIND